MRVKCVRTRPRPEIVAVNGGTYIDSEWPVDIGREYLVLGLNFMVEALPVRFPSSYGNGASVQIEIDPGGYILDVPLDLFELVDPRCSALWETRYYEDNGTVTLWPPAFYSPFFHDRQSDGDPETMAVYERTVLALSEEFNDA